MTYPIINVDEFPNKWIFGSPPEIKEGSYFNSNVMQVKYIKNPTKDDNILNDLHYHTDNIEEFYLVLNGSLIIEVDNKSYNLKQKEILRIPPKIKHKLCSYSDDIELLIFRAPPSREKNKVRFTK